MSTASRWSESGRASAMHFGLSLAVAGIAAVLVFAFWYPGNLRHVSGGQPLFLILVAVDVVVGPLLTFVVFDRRKPQVELVRDLSIIATLQLAALAYGLHTVWLARPAVVALEQDRLRVVRMIDMRDADYSHGPPDLRVSWLGPVFVATRAPTAAENVDAMDRGLAGEDIGMRPKFWLPSAKTGDAYTKAAKPIAHLKILRPSLAQSIESELRRIGAAEATAGYLPMLARDTDWSAVVDLRTGKVIGYLQVDGF